MQKGTRVVYVPSHAIGGIASEDAQFGVVKRQAADDSWFVIYDQDNIEMTTGDEDYTAACTSEIDLRLLDENSAIESLLSISDAQNNSSISLSEYHRLIWRLYNIMKKYNIYSPEVDLATKLEE